MPQRRFPGGRSLRTLSGATATRGKPIDCRSRSTRPRSTAFAFVTLASISTGRWTRARHSRWLESLRTTPGCCAAVVGTGLTPFATPERAATARVRRGAIARRPRPGRWMPLGQPAHPSPKRFPCLGRRALAMYALARPAGQPCRRWLTPGSSRSRACGPLLSARTEGVLSRPCPSLDRPWLAPLTAMPNTGDSPSTSRLSSQRRRPRLRVSTPRASLVVGPMRAGARRRGLRPRRATRVRVVPRRRRRPVLARAAITAGTRVVVTRRRRDCHCKVGGSVDHGGIVGRVPLLCFCRVTCVRPLPSFLLIIVSMKEVASKHGSWSGSRISCIG